MAHSRPVYELVSEHVKSAGFDHKTLAKKTKWSEQRVYRLLTGKTELRVKDMAKLAEILGKPVEALYREARAS